VSEPIDISGLLELRRLQAPGRPDAVARIVGRFLEESVERVTTMDRAAAADDAPGLERTAHALKGIAGTVGANEMLELAVRLEQIGREGHTRGAGQLVTELKAAFRRAHSVYQRLTD
jgi:HPt (histidine-containing phosphotransfer) domain-containing protein